MNTVSISRKTLEDWALSLSQGDISPRWEIEDLLAQPEQPEPCVNCSGSGITPIGDGYSVDACPQCTAEQPEAGRDELLPCAWCGSPAASIGMAGIPEPYADREMFTCSNEECAVGEASFSRNQWNRRALLAHNEPVKINVKFETGDKTTPMIGTTYVDVKRVEMEDDGSYTAVVDHWCETAEAVRLLKAIVEVANDVGEKHGRIRRVRELDALLEQAEQFLAQHGGGVMSELPITHCEHGIDRAYRCIDCIEAERDALRAWVEELEIEREAQRSCAIYWMDQEDTLRTSIAALAEEWERVAARAPEQVYVTAWQETLAECATKLRKLAEGNSAAAQEGL